MSIPPDLVSPAPNSPLAQDLPCLHCGYNLRTRLPSDRCPECNTPVNLSIEYHLTHRIPPPNRIFFTALLFVIAFAANFAGAVMTAALHATPGTQALFVASRMALPVLTAVLLPVAYALLWRLAPDSCRHALRRILYHSSVVLLALASLAIAVVTIVAHLALIGRLRISTALPLGVVFQGAALLQGLSFLILQVYAAIMLFHLATVPVYRSIRLFILPSLVPHSLWLLIFITQYTQLLLQLLLFPTISLAPLRNIDFYNILLRLLGNLVMTAFWLALVFLARKQRRALPQ